MEGDSVKGDGEGELRENESREEEGQNDSSWWEDDKDYATRGEGRLNKMNFV